MAVYAPPCDCGLRTQRAQLACWRLLPECHTALVPAPEISERLEAWNAWKAGVAINGDPLTADRPEYASALAAFYGGWDARNRHLGELS